MRLELRAGFHANGIRAINGQMFNLLPRVQRKPSLWASEVRLMPMGGPISGNAVVPYDHRYMPHAVEIMDAADDPNVRVVVNWSAVRDAKTAICLNIMGRTVTDKPGGIYSVHPIDDDVAKFSNDDVEPMIDLCLSEYFVAKKSRDSGRTINYKKFRGGSIRIVNAGGITKFRGSTVTALFLHEIDGYGRNLKPSHDPKVMRIAKESIHKAINRTKGIADAIIFLESTCTYAPTVLEDGTLEYNSPIQEWHDKGDKRKWFCRCRACGAMQWMKYAQIQARTGDKREARYYCEQCDADHTPRQWRRMCEAGIWYPTAGLTEGDLQEIEISHKDARALQPEVRSYWRNGFSSLLPHHTAYASKLHEFLAEGEAAKSSKEAEKTWTNEIAAELWSLEEEKVPPPAYQPILDGREDYQEAPLPALVLTNATDVHGDRLEVEWRAWARNEENWGMGHFVLFGDTNRTEVWEEWTTHLQRTFPHASGAKLRLALALVDGGWRVDPILATLRRLALHNVPGVSGKIIVSKGVPEWQGVIHRNWATIKDRAKGIHIGTWAAKGLIYDRLEWHSSQDKPTSLNGLKLEGFIHFSRDYQDEFIRQIVSESPVFQIIKGVNVRTFKNPEGNRNEALDLLVGNLAAFRRRRWDFDQLQHEIDEQVRELKETAKSAPAPTLQRETTSDWMGGIGRGFRP
jgi:phage terminase large subunit GpA-like protein